jgi:putative ABC transport system permease protein
MSNAFRVSAGERTKQFGILKSVGATSKQIRSTVINEGWLLAIAGIPLGIMVGLGVEAIGCVIANYCLAPLSEVGEIAIKMNFKAPWWVIVFAALLAFATIFLSAYLPARKAAKIPAIDAIRGSGEVKLKAKKVRTAGAVRKIFGVEGELAQKSMKRSRRSYRATVIALSSSVILFLVGTSLGQSVKVSVNMIYPNIEATATAQITASTSTDMEGNIVEPVKLTDTATARTLTEKFKQFDPTAPIKMLGENSGNSVFTVEAKNIFTPQSYENLTKDDDLAVDDYIITFKYIILDDAFYESVCKQAGVQKGENILLNQVLDRVDGKRALFSPCRSGINAIEVTGTNDDNSVFTEIVPIDGQLTELPPELLFLTSPYSVCVVTPNKSMTSVQWLVNVEDSAGFAEFAKATLKNTLKVEQTGLYNYNATDVKVLLAAQNGLANLIMIFVYGFIAMLTLIGLTNVISTISTNIRLRKREFAVLESMGMTEKGIKRMISYESLICGLRSLFFGLVLGLAASYFIYNRITDVLLFPYSFPYVPVIAAVITVFLVTFITMRFSAMRVSKGNIIEGIRQSE